MLQDRRSAHLGLVGLSGRSRLFAFLGPALLVSVGYMDPGNWATDLEAGARFGYGLLWVLAIANLIALLLQTLAARLGVVSGLDLAQACRAAYSRRISFALWLLAETAIIACDMAEVLGSAIALNMLFGIPVALGAVITVLDVFLILALQRRGVRALEAVALVLVLTIATCLATELVLSRQTGPTAALPWTPVLGRDSLYLAIGILGATVMPHNLYLHSALVKTRDIMPTDAGKREALRYYLIDTFLALNPALLINAAILILAASVFASRGLAVDDLRQAHQLLAPLLGTGAAAVLFALALLAAGQSSTITGTLAGQIIMDGFLRLRLPPIWRRSLTRCIAIVPAVIVLGIGGDDAVLPLLVATQVVLSLQLPFALVPLLRLTNSTGIMGAFANRTTVKLLAVLCAALIIGLNLALVVRLNYEWLRDTPMLGTLLALLLGCCLALLAWITVVRLRAP